jgi:hypothetical protein
MARYLVTIQFTLVLKQQQKLGVNGFIKSGKAVNSFDGNPSRKALSSYRRRAITEEALGKGAKSLGEQALFKNDKRCGIWV